MSHNQKIEKQLREFIIDAFGPAPQNKKEIGLYLKNFVLSKEYVQEFFDKETIEKYKSDIIYQFGEEFYTSLLFSNMEIN
jgi:hypothetical protein